MSAGALATGTYRTRSCARIASRARRASGMHAGLSPVGFPVASFLLPLKFPNFVFAPELEGLISILRITTWTTRWLHVVTARVEAGFEDFERGCDLTKPHDLLPGVAERVGCFLHVKCHHRA